jgi:hypothetical protein
MRKRENLNGKEMHSEFQLNAKSAMVDFKNVMLVILPR